MVPTPLEYNLSKALHTYLILLQIFKFLLNIENPPLNLLNPCHPSYRILDRLPLEPKENERWEITIDQIIKTFDAKKGIVYEVFHVFEGILLVSKVILAQRFFGFGF